MIEKLKTFLPALILLAFLGASFALWLPREGATSTLGGAAIQQLDARFEAGDAKLAGLMAVTHDRPVFHATRKPVAAPEVQKAPEPVLQLLGIISEDNGDTLAFVKISTSGALYRLAEGESVDRWEIVEIGTKQISVSKDGKAPYRLEIGG
ncbi:MAG: hypothetical protein OXC60_04620 [Litoreibacter sp.]|nr:hypothetical protein [Litoreibacter sp.]MCY4333940.1 hypothetical protein [Litoreibacter sp.]